MLHLQSNHFSYNTKKFYGSPSLVGQSFKSWKWGLRFSARLEYCYRGMEGWVDLSFSSFLVLLVNCLVNSKQLLMTDELSGWVVIVNGNGECSHYRPIYWLRLIGLVQRLAATWRCAALITWTDWTLAVAVPWWQHHKHWLWYYYYVIIMLLLCMILKPHL